MADNGKLAAGTPLLDAVLEKKTPDGKPVYPNGIAKRNDTADPLALIRNAMTAQADQNCVVVLAGPATNLAQVMDLAGSMELIQRKVKLLIIAAGRYPEGAADPRVKADILAARRLLAAWPTPIIAVGQEVGEALPFPGASIDKDFAWAPAHPVADAYRADHAMPYDAPVPSMAAALYAAHPDDFKLSAVGAVTVLDDGRTRFTPKPDGKVRYVTIDPDQKDKVIQSYVNLASAKPVARQGGRRGPPPKEP
jgi:inosine-uridine nucleoside N-ribohydrolase